MHSTLFNEQGTARALSTLEGIAPPDAAQTNQFSPADHFAEERIALLALALSRSATPSASVLTGAQKRLFGDTGNASILVADDIGRPAPHQAADSAPSAGLVTSPATDSILRKFPTVYNRLWSWSGWAAALVLGCLWLLREAQSTRAKETSAKQSQNEKQTASGSGSTQTDGPPDEGDPTEPDDASGDPGSAPGAGKRDSTQRNVAVKPHGAHETITVLRQDFEKLKQELGTLKGAQATTLLSDPKVARPTIIELSDPARPAGIGKDKTPLSERIGEKLNRDLEDATGKEPDAPSAPDQQETPAKPRSTYFDRNAPSEGTFQVPGGVTEIGGGYFYDPNRNLIMEPTGDGQTFTLRTPGPDFDPANPRLMPTVDLSQGLPEPEPTPKPPTATIKPDPKPILTDADTTPSYIDNGYAWVDQTSGQGALILPPGVPSPPDGQSYWLWMTVPGRDGPVAVGRVEDVPTSGGSVEFTLPQSGLLPGSFILTQEGPGNPSSPSKTIILKGP
jgi:hypothetical protein